MKEYEDKTIESLLEAYVLAKKVGAESLCEELWKQMVEYDKQQTSKLLKEAREELDSETKNSC